MPRWLAIAVVGIVVAFVVLIVIGQLQPAPRKNRQGYLPSSSPNGFVNLFNRPTPVQPDALLPGGCPRTGSLISAGAPFCFIQVAPSAKKGQARELKLHVEGSNSATLATSSDGQTSVKSPDSRGFLEVGFGDDGVTVLVSCPSAPCQLRVVS